ncbi:protein of unknown function (plasmid) [Cupriavidus taiwanensis]|uniref:Uncharacterized protein n=1 Tax=Cupriavidus taiwanensis TaxID=164546 RepID=A0A9Q7V1U2_9BURK|nr:protein of unknown function [Cupriavidus taiwanensis]
MRHACQGRQLPAVLYLYCLATHFGVVRSVGTPLSVEFLSQWNFCRNERGLRIMNNCLRLIRA